MEAEVSTSLHTVIYFLIASFICETRSNGRIARWHILSLLLLTRIRLDGEVGRDDRGRLEAVTVAEGASVSGSVIVIAPFPPAMTCHEHGN